MAVPIEPFTWHRILWPDDAPAACLGALALCCAAAYLLTLGPCT
ncbi:hypothetical protein [Hymenobacter nivis]|nr:hypothetical protein [Hymenobacter nivis]